MDSRTCCSLPLCFLLSGFILEATIAQTAWLKAVAVCLSQFYPESEIKVLTGLCFPEGLCGPCVEHCKAKREPGFTELHILLEGVEFILSESSRLAWEARLRS